MQTPKEATDAFLAWLVNSHATQREKVAVIRDRYADVIAAMTDDDHRRVMRELKKRINSPKLVAERDTLLAAFARTYTLQPSTHPAPAAAPEEPAASTAEPGFAATRGDHLAAAVAADPDGRDAYLVYADWLIANGDPRGELITLSRANPSKEIAAALAAHRKTHRVALMGPLADCDDLMTEVQWHMGFIKKCRLAYTHERFNSQVKTRAVVEIPQLVECLLDAPGPGRFLQHLIVGIVKHDNNRYDRVAATIAARTRPSLRTLAFGDFTSDECELNWSITGDLSRLWRSVPELRELWLRSGQITVGAIDLPHLEKLETVTGGLEPASLAYLANADWPALRELSLQVGASGQGAATDVGILKPLLAAERVPRLRTLGITNCEFTDELCALLLESKLLPQLARLDLSMGTMGDDGADVLLGHAARFAHLESIAVDDNYIGPERLARLKQTFPSCLTGAQRGPEAAEDRTASAYE